MQREPSALILAITAIFAYATTVCDQPCFVLEAVCVSLLNVAAFVRPRSCSLIAFLNLDRFQSSVEIALRFKLGKIQTDLCGK